MLGKRDKKEWKLMERELAAFDRQNSFKRNRKFEAVVSPEVIDLVKFECSSIRREVMMNALPVFTHSFYTKVRELYAEKGDGLHMIQAVDASGTPEDWMDMLFVLDQLALNGDSEASELANYICGYIEIADRKVAFEEAAKNSYGEKYASIEWYLNRIHGNKELLKQRLNVYLTTSEKAPNFDIVLIDTVEATFMDEENEDGEEKPVAERMAVDSKTAKALIEKLEMVGELESPAIARLLDFIPDREYWKDYFVRNITRRKEASNRFFESSFDSVISKLIGVVGEHTLFNCVTDEDLRMPFEKLKAMSRMSKENFSRLDDSEIMEVVSASKHVLDGMSKEALEDEYKTELEKFELYLGVILKKHFAYLQKVGLIGAFKRGNGSATFDQVV